MKILITTSTFPVSDIDKVPAFVKDQAVEIKKQFPDTNIIIHAPHNAHGLHSKQQHSEWYKEKRYHYFWPFRWELLTGRGILPALKSNPLLYLQIPCFVFFQFLSLLKLVRKEKPDIIYVHWFTPQAITSALVSKITKTPFIFTTHASDVSVLKKMPFSKRLVVWVCKNASAYTAVSPRTADKLRHFFTDKNRDDLENKLSIIPMGVKTNVAKLEHKDTERVRKLFDLPPGKQYVLYLGRLADKKGVKYLLDGFAKLSPTASNKLHLIIAGDGQIKGKLEKQARDLMLKNVTFTGYVGGIEKDALFAIADFTCLPSIIDTSGDSEGFPVVLMESLAAGKIVLASNVTGGEEIINSGKDGYIFAEKSASEISKLLTKVSELDSAQRTAIQKRAAKLAKQFDWTAIAKKHYDIMLEVITER